VAAAIVFLASVHAGFMTGQAICVDGGASRTLL
jgi:NAD(P)-dependent dehydrogenase (short-subunit alcohol dehydrogenase family)